MIVDKELIVSNRRKADIVAELRRKDFRPFSKVSQAKAAGETEDVVEEDEDEDSGSGSGSKVTDYDYLLGMAIWSLTKEKVRVVPSQIVQLLIVLLLQIDKLKQQAKEKEEELLTLLALTPIQIWHTDLDAFLAQWKVS